jgi:hypothetical protein
MANNRFDVHRRVCAAVKAVAKRTKEPVFLAWAEDWENRKAEAGSYTVPVEYCQERGPLWSALNEAAAAAFFLGCADQLKAPKSASEEKSRRENLRLASEAAERALAAL